MAFLLQKLNELRARQGFSLILVPGVASFSKSAALNVQIAQPPGEASARAPMPSRSTTAPTDGAVVALGLLNTLCGKLWDEPDAYEMEKIYA